MFVQARIKNFWAYSWRRSEPITWVIREIAEKAESF